MYYLYTKLDPKWKNHVWENKDRNSIYQKKQEWEKKNEKNI